MFKQLTINTVFLLFVVLLMTTSCKKEVVEKLVEKEKVSTWQLVQEFNLSFKPQLAAYLNGETLYTLGLRTFSHVRVSKDSLGLEVTHYDPNQAFHPDGGNYLSENYFLKFVEKGLNAYSSKNPVGIGTSEYVNLSDLDTSMAPLTSGAASAISDLTGQCLISYSQYSWMNGVRVLNSKGAFFLISFKEFLDNRIRNLNPRKIESALNPYNIQTVHAFNGVFYAAFANGTIRLDTSLLESKISDATFYKMFSHNGILYGATWNGYYQSTDNGLNWTQRQNYYSNLYWLSFSHVGSNLIGFYNSQIFSISIDSGLLKIEELVNDGLEGNVITSVNKLGNKVIVTSLSGVFQRDYMGFLTVK